MHLAKTMVALVIVAVSIGFLGNICKFTALMLLKGNLAGSFEPDQVYDLVALFLKIDAYGIEISQLYWGLWLFPFGLLVYRSGFIPRILGLLLIVNGVAYIILYLTFVLFPDYISVVYKFGTPCMAIGEIPTMF